jgi:uncharacterized cupredoxin-like copper-binding protein
MRGGLRCSVGVLAGLSLLLSACSGSSPKSPGTITVTERDFHIAAPVTLPSGNVTLAVHNEGPDAHELIAVKDTGSGLPLRGDGLTVDEDGLGGAIVGALEPGPPESVRTLHVHLAPGRYVFICNMAGHYMGGMATTVVVR